jgi:uncharacterized protein DUF4939/zinc knuckle protein
MPPAPRPPFLPQNLEEFAEHFTGHQHEWFEYCRRAYEVIEAHDAALAESLEAVRQAEMKLEALQLEHNRLKENFTRAQGIREYQDEQLQKMQQKLVDALKERDQAVALSAPVVNTPRSSPVPACEPAAEAPVAATLGAPAPSDTVSAGSAKLSERLPDPDKFEGDRKDLRRFVSQIHEKMNVNRDRFPTSQSRMTYVTNRLKGAPYAQILPYIHRGVCQLEDYDKILDILDRAFGDPNRVNNARNELFRLRQTHKEFGLFFAEFQRLALEGEMSEDALPTLLEQAISRELRGMLMHNEPPSREYHQFANFLQDLENRRRHYENISTNTRPATNRPAPANRPTERTTDSQPQYTKHATSAPERAQAPPNPDAMDLSATRRMASTRRERGECFRCGSKEHQVRDCPLPDRRPLGIRPAYTESATTPERPASPVSYRSESPDHSAKGVSLV